MTFPDISKLAINGARTPLRIPNDAEDAQAEDRCMQKFNAYAKSLPYSIEPPPKMTELLDFIVLRIVQCVEAKDYDAGLLQWDSMLT